ncbi:MAG: hypothetical protein AAFV59_18320, partial [Pseudomonadota bacterium]
KPGRGGSRFSIHEQSRWTRRWGRSVYKIAARILENEPGCAAHNPGSLVLTSDVSDISEILYITAY